MLRLAALAAVLAAAWLWPSDPAWADTTLEARIEACRDVTPFTARRECFAIARDPTLCQRPLNRNKQFCSSSGADPASRSLLFAGMNNLASGLYGGMSDPQNCVVCYLLLGLVNVVVPVGHASYSLLLAPVTLLLGVGLAAALTIGAGQILYMPGSPQAQAGWQGLLGTSIRFIVALLLVGGASALGATAATSASASATGVFDHLYCRLVGPALGLSVQTGLVLLEGASGIVDGLGGRPGGGLMDQARIDAELFLSGSDSVDPCDAFAGPGRPSTSGLHGLSVLAAGLQRVGQLGLAQGVGFIRDAALVGGGAERWVAVVGGVLVMMMYAMFLVTAAMRLVDPVLRLALVLAASPLLCAAWVFRPTRRMAEVGARSFLYAVLYFLLCGVVYGVSFSIISGSAWHSMSGAQAGASAPDCSGWDPSSPDAAPPGLERCTCRSEYVQDYAGLVRCVLHTGGALDYGAPREDGTPSVNLTQVVVSIIGLLLAQGFIGVAGTFAGALSDYQAGENVAAQAESQMRGLATSGVSAMAYVGATAVSTGLKVGKRAVTGKG